MKKLFLTSMAGFLGVFLVSVLFGGFAWSAEKKYELRYASEYMDKHPTVVNGILPWIQRVKELSGGRLAIQFFNPNTIAPAREAYSSVVAGSVDMTGSPCHFVRGKFPLSGAIQLPLIFNGAEAGSLTTWEIYQRYPEWRDEYKDVKLLWQWTSALFELHMKNKLVRTLEDLEGMKMIAWNPSIRRIIKDLGANPVEVTPHDTYLALERGMADGVMCPLAPMKSFKITDAAKYHTIVDIMCDVFYGAMNMDKWESLPSDLQKILEDTTRVKMAQICGKTLDEGAIKDANWMKSEGHTFCVLSPAEKKRWKEKVKGLHEEWIEMMVKKGYENARKIHDEIIRLGEQYSKTTTGGYKE